jgi:hypothetical protein
MLWFSSHGPLVTTATDIFRQRFTAFGYVEGKNSLIDTDELYFSGRK